MTAKPRIVERVRRAPPMTRVVVEFEADGYDGPRRVIVTDDPKGGCDLAVRSADGRAFADSWFLTPAAAEAVVLALSTFYGIRGTAAFASKGGKARAASMTAEERSKVARKAAEARWKKSRKKPSPETPR